MLRQSLILGLSLFTTLHADNITHSMTHQSPTTTSIHTTINLAPKDALYTEYLEVRADHPAVSVNHTIAQKPTMHFDPQLSKDVALLKSPITLNITATKKTEKDPQAHLLISYITRDHQTPQEHSIPLSFAKKKITAASQPRVPVVEEIAPKKSWAHSIESLIEQSSSRWIQALLAFLLGLLMSLTPCIYPMIPITVGILQAQGKKSIGYNFLISLAYTCGIATTFALCGVTAALTGAVCGKMLINPFFVLLMVAVLLYFAAVMFGIFEMKVPRFMQNQTSMKGGSILSIFAFGLISGTVASPCLTPGLALLLTIVGAIGSYVLGFILLFAFGIGLSVPLLIVGTFSSSLNMMPRAGMWMLEVKKIFGFMLIGMCFYFLNNITPWWLMLWLMGATVLISGIYYLFDAQKTIGAFGKTIKNIIGMAAVAGSIMIFANAYHATFAPEPIVCHYGSWETDYEHARSCAVSANKKIFIDFWATFCSICKAIDKTILSSSEMDDVLRHVVGLKVDGTNPASEPFAMLNERYHIKGFPTFLLIDPATGEIIKQWGSEIYHAKAQFLAELKQFS
jgi:thioredoxin:protein disulfide reductase